MGQEMGTAMTVLMFAGIPTLVVALILFGVFRILTENNRPWPEKLLWLLAIVASKGAAALLLIGLYTRNKLWRYGAVVVLALWALFVWNDRLVPLFVDRDYSDVVIHQDEFAPAPDDSVASPLP